MYMSMYVYVHIYIYIYIHICVYIYIYIHMTHVLCFSHLPHSNAQSLGGVKGSATKGQFRKRGLTVFLFKL